MTCRKWMTLFLAALCLGAAGCSGSADTDSQSMIPLDEYNSVYQSTEASSAEN